ncbi:MAG: HNH endonuclease [Actinomycetota bacterium]|nr:HNH endonuclease [Actinomycetota bacterium]
MFDTMAMVVGQEIELPAEPTDGETRAERVSRLASLPAGPGLMILLSSQEDGDLDDDDRLVLLAAWERAAAWVAGRQQRLLAGLTGARYGQAGRSPGPEDWVREELAAALRLSPVTAGRRLEVARTLAGSLPATRAALERGEISYGHACVLADAVDRLTPLSAAAVESRVLDRARTQTPGRLRRITERAVIEADPANADIAHAAAIAKRDVVLYPRPFGMATVAATMSAPDAELVLAALDRLARDRGREGLIGNRRVDALVELAAAAESGPGRASRPAAVAVTVDLATVLGLADRPGELVGYGPIPAGLARTLAADGAWTRWILTPRGGLLDRGRTTYCPPAALASYVAGRDGTCRFPGCAQPARRCDIDHTVAFDAGGGTDRDNLGLLCRRHHRLKHEAGWQLERHPDESVTWTSPSGETYHVPLPGEPPDG